MFDSLLIANRGEIARRIMRTCRAMGIRTVAVFSDADADAAFVHEADAAVGIGGSAPAESYLRADAVLDAARRSGAAAIHPGYGFLAENAAFARAVTGAGLVWVGPPPEAIEAMGSKIEAKRRMEAAGVPLLPSVELDGLDGAAVTAAAARIGFPVLVKASAGGGGRGMRIVSEPSGLADAVAGAAREATSAFGDGTLYAERYVSPARHVEVQIFGDRTGRVIHLHERECSIQRRHQKIIEEAPSPSIGDEVRAALHEAAVRAGAAIGYTNAGTVEFLVAPGGDFYFLEVNTRLQVEHPVTEAVLGLDLVRLQLEVAAGAEVPDQGAIGPVVGHAIEARVYAEDPTQAFLPSTGTVRAFAVPGPVRVDGALDGAGEVSQHYDPMIAKVIAHAPTRDEAARTLAASLRAATVAGIRHNGALLVRTLTHPEYRAGGGDTGFLERHDPAELGRPLLGGVDRAAHLAAAALALQAANRAATTVVPAAATGFRNVPTQPQAVRLRTVDGDDDAEVTYRFDRGVLVELGVDGLPLDAVELRAATAEVVDLAVGGVRRRYRIGMDGDHVWVSSPLGTLDAARLPRFEEPDDAVEAGSLVASMPGTVRVVAVAEGDVVEAGATLVVLEAMKMELAVRAPAAGTVSQVNVAVGDTVDAGTLLVVVEEGG